MDKRLVEHDIQLDLLRSERIGIDEAILCLGKSEEQIHAICAQLLEKEAGALFTRLESNAFDGLEPIFRDKMDYDPVSKTGFFNRDLRPASTSQVAIVAAGSSDLPAAQEALRTLSYLGIGSEAFVDVGVAGLWRLTSRIDEIKKFPVIIAVAGMDGALPSVLGGLVPGAIIVVPTSTGYGVANKGETALHAALASCAQGLAVVNIDNGFGAACAAARILNSAKRS